MFPPIPPNCPLFEGIGDLVCFRLPDGKSIFFKEESILSTAYMPIIASVAAIAWTEERDDMNYLPSECLHERDSTGYDFYRNMCEDNAYAWRDLTRGMIKHG